MKRSRRLAVGALVAALLGALPATAEQEGPDERATARLDAVTGALAKATRLRTTIDADWDVTQPTGEKVEFGETRVMTIRRPDRARIETTRRDGTRRVFLFDGTQLAVSDPDAKVYATAQRPGSLDAALAYLTQDLDMRMPLRELFGADLAKMLAPFRGTASSGLSAQRQAGQHAHEAGVQIVRGQRRADRPRGRRHGLGGGTRQAPRHPGGQASAPQPHQSAVAARCRPARVHVAS